MNHCKQCSSTKEDTKTNDKLSWNKRNERRWRKNENKLRRKMKKESTTYNRGIMGIFKILLGVPANLLVPKAKSIVLCTLIIVFFFYLLLHSRKLISQVICSLEYVFWKAMGSVGGNSESRAITSSQNTTRSGRDLWNGRLHPAPPSFFLQTFWNVFFFLPFGLVIPKEKKRCIPKFNFTLVILEVEKNNRKQLESARNNLEVQEATACEMIVKWYNLKLNQPHQIWFGLDSWKKINV